MSQCSKCGAVSQGVVAFCTQCGSAIPVPTSTSFAGRPIVSMDPRKQAQVSENPGGPATLMQPHATSQVSSSSSNTNKIAIGAVGVIVAIVAIVFLLGRNDSESPSVSPSNQQSRSSSSEESDEYYAGYDDYSIEFRDAFLDSCSEESNYQSCLCSLEKMESLYSIAEVGTIFDSGEDLSWFYEQIGSGCF